MNYYPFHLGDYAAHTAHLEPMEDLAYRRMLDLYYRTEKPLPLDWREIARLIRLRDQGDAIEAVLSEFFTVTDEGWHHGRCERELQAFRAMVDGGKRGAAKRWAKGGDGHPIATPLATLPTPQCQPEPEPITKEKKDTARASRLPADWVLPDDWKAWAKQERPDLDPAAVACDFRDYWIAKPGKDGTKLDWLATWRKWVRNANAPRRAFQPPSAPSAAPPIYVPPPRMTDEEKAANRRAAQMVMAAVKRIPA